MIELLQKYGIPLDQLNADSLIRLRGIYESEVKTLKGEADSADQVTGGWLTALGATVQDNESVQTALTEFKLAVRELMYALVDSDTNVCIPLVDALAEIKTSAMNERDYWVQRVKRENTAAKPGTDSEFDEKLSEMEDLAKLIRLSFQFVSSALDLDDPEFKAGFPTIGKIEKGKATDERLPNLTRLPNRRNAESGAGRNASHRFIQFTWNGEDIPLGTLTADVAHDYVSDIKRGVMVSGPDILKAIKDSEQEWLAAEGWSLEFNYGKDDDGNDIVGILTGKDSRQ